MRLFSHTIAEYTCTKHCGFHRSINGANLSRFHAIAAVVAALPLWLVSLCEPWHFPWYYIISIIAGEFLLVFFSGFLSMLLSAPFTITRESKSCAKCGAPMFFAGRHFDLLGSQRPHWSDILIFAVFVGLNIVVWFTVFSR
jgi:hypothetical protein